MGARSLTFAFSVAATLATGTVQASDLKARCERDGKYKGGTPATTEGLLEGRMGTAGFEHIEALLLTRRFRFVEIERNVWPGDFHERRLGPESGERYLRFLVAPATDPRCAPFKSYYVSYRPRAPGPELRWKGLRPDQCLAVERTNELRAAIERVYQPEIGQAQGGRGEWGGWMQYRERVSGRVIGQVWTGGYGAGPLSPMLFDCGNLAEYSKLDALVTAAGPSDLDPLPPVSTPEGLPFPIRRTASVVSIGSEEPFQFDSRRPATTYDDWDVPGLSADNGLSYLTSGGQLDKRGKRMQLIRPGVRLAVNVTDNGVPFVECDSFARVATRLSMLCQLKTVGVPPAAKVVRGNWRLAYEDDGRPAEIVEFRFDETPLADLEWVQVRSVTPLEGDLVKSRVSYFRGAYEKRMQFQAQVTFRIASGDK